MRSLGILSSIRPTRVSRRERRSRPFPVSIAVVDPVRAAHPAGGAGELSDLGGHQSLAGEGQQLTDQIGIGALLDQLQQRHSFIGHRRLRLQVQLATEPYPKTGDDHLIGGPLLHHAQGHDPLRLQDQGWHGGGGYQSWDGRLPLRLSHIRHMATCPAGTSMTPTARHWGGCGVIEDRDELRKRTA